MFKLSFNILKLKYALNNFIKYTPTFWLLIIIVMLSSLKLESTTPLDKQSLKKVNIVIQSLFNNTDSIEFRQPVDWKGFGLTDYPLIVKTPMDLGTVKKKLINNKYETVESVLDDIQLIWDNCKTYNEVGSWIHSIAEKLERSFKKMIKNYFSHVDIPASSIANKGEGEEVEDDLEISYQDRMKFSERLKQLNPKQLGEIVEMIQKESADVFKYVEKDRAHIVVDNIGNQLFYKLLGKLDGIQGIGKQ